MEAFYEKHYGQEAGESRVKALIRLIEPWLALQNGRTIKILDIGCGNMMMAEAYLKVLESNGIINKNSIQIVGWDCSQRAVAEARSRGWQADVRDVTSAPIGNDEKDGYDLVVFLEVLEHLVDTDLAIKNIHGLLKPDGVLVLSTPNLAAWYNRVLLLLGFQPHMTEVSNCPIRFGCRFIGKLLGEQEGVTNISAGHLRLFTFRALKEFLSYHQFKIDKIWGVSNHKYDFVSKILAKMWVGGSGNLICFVRKK